MNCMDALQLDRCQHDDFKPVLGSTHLVGPILSKFESHCACKAIISLCVER